MRFPFKQAERLLDQLINHGFGAYIVGGAVRDYLLGRPIHDIDIATSARPADVVSLFKRTIPVGIDHGTVAVLSGGKTYEITTFRSEAAYEDYRHPSQVAFVSSVDQDLMRRDFTINALAMDRTGKIIDLFNGQRDLRMKRIRTVGCAEERISEDPLRIMRGMRFASELEFTLGSSERHAFRKQAALLKNISIERVNQEMTRLFAGKAATQALRLLFETQCIHVLPLLEQADAKEVLDVHFTVLRSDAERWTAFLSALGIKDSYAFAKAWKWSNRLRQQTAHLLDLLKLRKAQAWTRETIYSAGPDNANAADRVCAALGMILQSSLADRECDVRRIWEACPIHSRAELAATGNEFKQWANKRPGPWLAQVISELEREVVNERVKNETEEIRLWFKEWSTQQKEQF